MGNGKWEMAAPEAVQRHNPYTGQWETTLPDNVIKHNPYNGQWSYEKPDSKPILSYLLKKFMTSRDPTLSIYSNFFLFLLLGYNYMYFMLI